jgi:hypothetical protein
MALIADVPRHSGGESVTPTTVQGHEKSHSDEVNRSQLYTFQPTRPAHAGDLADYQNGQYRGEDQ